VGGNAVIASPAAPPPGRLVDGRWWVCPNCPGKVRLGEIVGRRVVVRYDRLQGSHSIDADPYLTCWKCGTVSRAPEET
jgi:hypothetical protein